MKHSLFILLLILTGCAKPTPFWKLEQERSQAIKLCDGHEGVETYFFMGDTASMYSVRCRDGHEEVLNKVVAP
jgi:hypothetical protein